MPTRRSFLLTPAALAAVSGSSVAATSSAGFSFGVATYSLRMFQRPLAIRMIRQLGIDRASVKEFHLPYRLPADELAKAAAEFTRGGVTIESGGGVYMLKPDEGEIRR